MPASRPVSEGYGFATSRSFELAGDFGDRRSGDAFGSRSNGCAGCEAFGVVRFSDEELRPKSLADGARHAAARKDRRHVMIFLAEH